MIKIIKKENLNKYKEIYLKPTQERVVDQKRMKLVADYILPKLKGNRVLELGVGDQIWTPKLIERFTDVVTIDGSSELLAEMKKRLGEKHWKPVVSFFENYKPEKPFDIVLMTYVLEHVDNPLEILNLACKSWLKDEGLLVVIVPHALSLHRRLGVKMGLISFSGELGESDRLVGHKWCFSCYEMEKLVMTAGFEVIESKGMFTTIFPNNMLVQCSDEQLRGMFNLGLDLPIEYSSIIYFIAKIKRR